jgi:hypothetical protein
MLYSCNIHKYDKVELINNGFLNTNTAITRQLMRTARQNGGKFLGGSVSTEANEDESILGAFGPLDFTVLRPVLAWQAF